MFNIAIIGRPNVGKSTLFNALVGRRTAITCDLPGVTRDRKEANINFDEMDIKIVDTAGYETKKENKFKRDIAKQIDFAVIDADLLFLVIDAKSGFYHEDYEFISYVRTKDKPIILIVNKSEVKNKILDKNDIYKLGFKDIAYISAANKLGFDDLSSSIYPYYQTYKKLYGEGFVDSDSNDLGNIRISIVGKPNVGKSTLINNLINNNRLITSDESGTTRDSIEIRWKYKDRDIVLIDTAGLRKRNRIYNKLEKLSYDDSIKSIRFAQICVMLFDVSNSKLMQQDITIASHIINEGRGLVIVLNKIDLLNKEELEEIEDEIRYQIGKYVPQNKNLSLIKVSALEGSNLNKIISQSISVYDNWNVRINTNELNLWLENAVTKHQLPMYNGKVIKMKYITQVKSRPPTFVIMTNYPDKISQSYIRYLKLELVNNFGLYGVNPRLIFKSSNNPYNKKKAVKTTKM